MKLDEILSKAGKYKPNKRLGRGLGSGQGKTSGRGTKGAGSRSGWKQRIGYEGGQIPFYARLPKRGFSNAAFKVEYQPVNLDDIQDAFPDGATVDAKALHQADLISSEKEKVKVLGSGELTKKLTIIADMFSKSAAEKIAKAGGKAEGKVAAARTKHVDVKIQKIAEKAEKAEKAPKKEAAEGQEKAAKKPKAEKAPKEAKADKGAKAKKSE